MEIKKEQIRARPAPNVAFVSASDFDTLCTNGYTSLDRNPEVLTAARAYADAISSMTIHLMANTEGGDIRIKNELSKMVDITPYRYSTRKTWMDFIVMTLLLHGRGNAIVFPHTEGGRLIDMEPISAGRTSFLPKGDGYTVRIDGAEFEPDTLLHFVNNPDPNAPWRGIGFNAQLKEVAHNLKQAAATARGFMASKWKPSLVVKVDGLVDEFSSPEGRKKLLNEYFSTAEAGEPWMIPAAEFDVQQVRPLSLSDLAISDVVELDKKTVASITGVPPYMLGVGTYSADEHNSFINNKVRPICREIEQEMTRKLLVSPKMYWRFNVASSFSYDLEKTEKVYSDLYVRGIATGNEVRERLGMEPKEGLDELVILENYIPLNKIGEQLKLGGNE